MTSATKNCPMQKLSELITLLLDIKSEMPQGFDPEVAIWDQWDEEGAVRQYDTITNDSGIVRFNLTSETVVARTPHEAVAILHRYEQIPAHEDH